MGRDRNKNHKEMLYRFVLFILLFSNVFFIPSLARAIDSLSWAQLFSAPLGDNLNWPGMLCFRSGWDARCLAETDYNALPQSVIDLFASNPSYVPTVDASGNLEFPNGTTLGQNYEITAPPPTPPPTLETAMRGIVSGDLYDQNGQVYAHIAPGDLAGVPDANVTCTASDSSTTSCVYVAPSGNSYTTYLPTGAETGSSNAEAALRDLYQTARAMPGTINTWDSRDIALQNAVMTYASNENTNFAISESGGYVLAVAQTTNGSSEVVIDLYNTPNKMNAYGQYNPSTDMEEKLVTLSFGRGSMTENYTVNNVSTGQVQTVDNTVGAVEVLSGMPQLSAVSGAVNYYVTGSSVTAVNSATGQMVGKVNLSGQQLTPYRVERVVEAINNNPVSVHGGSAIVGSAPGANSGNVGSNTSQTAGSLPTGPASQAGSGSGTNQTGSEGFYKSQYPEGTTLQTIYASHLATIQALPFVTGLNGFKPTFGSGGLPQMCFTLIMFPGNYCLDFGQYAFVFDTIKAIVLISAVYAAYSIIIVKRA